MPIRTDDAAPPERWKHGQDLAPPVALRMPSTVRKGVDALRYADPPAIGDAEVAAAARFVRDYLLGIEGVREASGAVRSGSADAHDVAIARAIAFGRHREIADVVGPKITAYWIDFLVNDLSFVAMSDRHWPGEQGRKEMRGAMAKFLELLSHLYAGLDRKRKRRAG